MICGFVCVCLCVCEVSKDTEVKKIFFCYGRRTVARTAVLESSSVVCIVYVSCMVVCIMEVVCGRMRKRFCVME